MEIVLDRFEYKLPENMYVVHKVSTGFKYKLKHSKKEFDSEEQCLAYIDKILNERKRYLKLVNTLTKAELSKLFSDEVLLGLTPSQIKEYEPVEQFVYNLEVDGIYLDFNELWQVKDFVASEINLTFHGDYNLVSSDGNVVVEGY